MRPKGAAGDVSSQSLTRLTSALSGARMPGHPDAIEDWVVEWLAYHWQRPPRAIDTRRSLVEQGLDSLGAVALAHDLARWLGLSLDVASLWRQRTVEGLARWLASAEELGAGPLAGDEDAAAPHGVLPASREQGRLWRLARGFPGRALHHVHFRLRFDGPLDVEALRRGLREVVRRHEALRTLFVEREGRLVQVVSPSLRLEMPLVDLSPRGGGGDGGALASETFRRLDASLARAPFDPRREPLIRATLVRLGALAHVLLVTQHRLVTDATSLGVFTRELASLYRVFRAGIPLPLAAPECQPADVARRQRAWLASEAAARQRDYWRQRLAGSRPRVWSAGPRDADRPPEGDTVCFELPAPLVAATRAVAARADATLFVALSAAFAALLRRHSGRGDLVLGAEVANRESREAREVLGPLANLVALRCDVSGNPSFHALLSRHLATTLEALAHQRLPFDEVADLVAGEWGEPRLQAACLFERVAPLDLTIPGLACELLTDTPDGSLPGTARFDLALLLREEPAGVRAALEYSTARFHREEVERLAGAYLALLGALASTPDAGVDG